MDQLIPYLIKSTSILLVSLVYYKLFLRKQTFFTLSRWYLLSALLIAIITPFIYIEIQSSLSGLSIHQPVKNYVSHLLDEVYVLGNLPSEDIIVNHASYNWLYAIYWIGVAGLTCRYIFAFIQIQYLIHHNPHYHFHNLNIVFLTNQQSSFSYFNYLFINFSLSREDRRKIFEHEKIHICQHHSLDLLISEIICISNWFNPLVWIFKNAITENHEYITDHQMIRKFHIGSYLDLLIRQTFKSTFSFTNYFSCTNLKKRTIMMTKKQSRKCRILSFIPITAILITLLYGFICCNNINKNESSEYTKAIVSEQSLIQEKDSIFFVVVEKMPEFPGEKSIQKWIHENVKYPEIALENGIQGKVYVKFIIEKDGTVTEPKVIKGVDTSLDKEAIRVIQSMPKWKPGKQRGKTVRVSFTIPINFSLPNSTKDTTASAFPDSEDIFAVVEKMPVFIQGDLQRWLTQNTKYPKEAKEQNIQGKVYVQFVVEKDGSITEPKIAKGVNPLLDNEALRVVKLMPKWKPGEQRGHTVRVSYIVPINFALNN